MSQLVKQYARKPVIRANVWKHLAELDRERGKKAMSAFHDLLRAGPSRLSDHAGVVGRAVSERGKTLTICIMFIEQLALVIKIRGIRVHLESVIDLLRLARRRARNCCRVLREEMDLGSGVRTKFELFVDGVNRMVFRCDWVRGRGVRLDGYGYIVRPL